MLIKQLRVQLILNKIKLRQASRANRVKSIPENAIIRKEYIKCGKQMCLKYFHGPPFKAACMSTISFSILLKVY